MDSVKEKVKNGDIQQGLKIFLIELDILIKKYSSQVDLKNLRNTTINLLSILNNLNKDRILGIIEDKLYFIETNKISKNLLYLVDELEGIDISKFEKLTGTIYKEEILRNCLQQIINYKNNYSPEKDYRKIIREISEFFVNNLIKEAMLFEIYRLKANEYESHSFEYYLKKRIEKKAKEINLSKSMKQVIVEFMDKTAKETSLYLKNIYEKNRIVYSDFKGDSDMIFLSSFHEMNNNIHGGIESLLSDNDKENMWYKSDELLVIGVVGHWIGMCTLMLAFPITIIPAIVFGFWLGPKWLGKRMENKKLNELINKIENTDLLINKIENKMLEGKGSIYKLSDQINELVISIIDKQINNLESEIINNMNKE